VSLESSTSDCSAALSVQRVSWILLVLMTMSYFYSYLIMMIIACMFTVNRLSVISGTRVFRCFALQSYNSPIGGLILAHEVGLQFSTCPTLKILQLPFKIASLLLIHSIVFDHKLPYPSQHKTLHSDPN
jgi:hypothetical protein